MRALKLETSIREKIVSLKIKNSSLTRENLVAQSSFCALNARYAIKLALEPLSAAYAENFDSAQDIINNWPLANHAFKGDSSSLAVSSTSIYDMAYSIEQAVTAYLDLNFDTEYKDAIYHQAVAVFKEIFKIKRKAKIHFDNAEYDECRNCMLLLQPFVVDEKHKEMDVAIDSPSNDEYVYSSKNRESRIPDKSNNNRKKKITLIDITKIYNHEKSGTINQSTSDATLKKLTLVSGILKDKDIKDISRNDAIYVRDLLLNFPSNVNKFKEFEGKNVFEIIEKNKTLNRPNLSESTVSGYLQRTSSIIKHAIKHQHLNYNAFEGVSVNKNNKKVNEQRKAYDRKDIKLLLSTEIHTKLNFKKPSQYWLPLLGCYTGARLNELCQLYKSDIVKFNGVWCIKFTDERADQNLKNPSSKRMIPVHSKLIELGFIEYIQSFEERIFPELKYDEKHNYGGAISKWFGRFKTKLGFNRGHDFHSFRHTVVNFFKQETEVEQRFVMGIVGHENGSITFDRYGKDFKPENLKKYIELIDWEIGFVQTYSNYQNLRK
ncbi:site-specific integrase [Vibrio metschnikovii]|nr:site-specific integrase [Vibrio metschnikovii]